MRKIIILIVAIGTLLFADAVKVTNIAEKATFIVQNIAGQGSGTGFLINDKGFVVTNNHVTDGYDPGKLYVLNKHYKYKDIKMIKTYPKKDITILKIENYSDGKFLRLQDPNLIKKGHKSFSLGYPGVSNIVGGDMEAQLDSTIKSGDVSKILTTSIGNGDFPVGYKLIETSSDINSGNSGGPLLSKIGTVIGINTLGPTVYINRGDINSTNNNTPIINVTSSQGVFWAIHVEELIKVLDENNIEYTLSTDNIGEMDTTDIQENISDVKSNSKLIFIAIAIIIAVLILIIYLVKKNSNNSVKSGEVSKLVRDKMKKYKKREDVLPTPSPTPSPQPKAPKKKTISILESLIPEDSSLPQINLESKKSITLGRSTSCDITINDTEISKEHLRITLVGALVEIEDLNSSNGTYIGGTKLDAHKKVVLQKDEQLIIANENNIYSIKGSKRKPTNPSIKLIPEDPSLPIIEIRGKVIVGRSSKSDITIDNSEVSRSHLELQMKNGKVQVTDLGSGNGTYINGIEVHKGETVSLSRGDELLIGSGDVVYKIG